jgi:simple sugar transport system substrate-binding protein
MFRTTKLIVINLFMIAALVALAACGTAPTAAPETEAPVQTEAQAPAPEQTEAQEPGPVATEAQAPATEPPQVTQAGLSIGLAVHSDPATDLFWGVVEKGASDAAATFGIDLRSGGSGDPQQQAQLIDTYIAANVDGIIVSMANPDALRDPIQKAVAAGIPVITINSGGDRSVEFGALAHVGQEETVAGQGAGNQFNAAGLTKVLCVIHEEGNVGLQQRCAGVAETFSGAVEEFNVATTGVNDPRGSTTAIQDKLTADPDIDAILALNPVIGIAARDAAQAAGSSARIATFDLSPDVLTALENDEMMFAIDQQQYLQGYLPVVMLYLYKTNLNTVGGGLPVLTGPGFVTKDTAAQVKDLSAQGTR